MRLAEETGARARGDEALFPTMAELRAVRARVAGSVVREARQAGVGLDLADESIPAAVAEEMWEPVLPLAAGVLAVTDPAWRAIDAAGR